MSLGIMQRRHFALTQINEAVDLMQDLSDNGMRLAIVCHSSALLQAFGSKENHMT